MKTYFDSASTNFLTIPNYLSIVYCTILFFLSSLSAIAQDCGTIRSYISCEEAVANAYSSYTDLFDFCSEMSETDSVNNEVLPGCPFTLQNPLYLSFTATSSYMELFIDVSNCDTVWVGPVSSFGIQVIMFEECNTEEIVYSHCACSDDVIFVGTSLKIGQVYTILIDGCSGDVCHLEISEDPPVSTKNYGNSPNFLLFPNPAIHEIILQWKNADQGPVVVQVFDMLGKEIFYNRDAARHSDYTKSLDITDWTSGTYFVKIRYKQKYHIQKFIKL